MRLSALERTPEPEREVPEATPEQKAGLATMTDKQRWLARRSAPGGPRGRSPSTSTSAAPTSTPPAAGSPAGSACDPNDVAEVAVALGITDEAGPPTDATS